ncbi:MAG: hypothetical protein AB4372_34425 [Xenococcus sp. (in: cyanobacteria)]
MILEKRKIHFYSAIALAIILPIVFIWGIVARPFYNIPNQSLVYGRFVPDKTLVETTNSTSITQQLTASINRDEFPKVLADEIVLDVAINPTVSKSVSLAITPQSILKFPDPLLYWQSDRNIPTEIDRSMILLGSLPGKASNIKQPPSHVFYLPPEALNQDGALVLYSQGYNAIAGIFPLCLQDIEQPFVCQES